jgi:glycosyltransferase involved in cell wall biosynthesis
MPFFSIIIPTYDSSATLGTALNSVMRQTFHDWELCVIDGCSNDNSTEIIKASAADDNRVHWISEKDEGVYDAMNKGVRMAKGEWLYFLGSDDYLFDKDVLAKVFAFMQAHPEADFIYGSVTSSYLGEKYDGAFDQMKLTRKSICHQAIFYKRTLFDLLGKYKLKYKVNSDWEFNLRCFFNPKINTQYIDLIIAYFSGGGLSNRVEDPVFSEERSAIIAYNGYHSIPLNKLKVFCKSNLEFCQLLLKRVFYHMGLRSHKSL